LQPTFEPAYKSNRHGKTTIPQDGSNAVYLISLVVEAAGCHHQRISALIELSDRSMVGRNPLLVDSEFYATWVKEVKDLRVAAETLFIAQT
jgi:hypothetical protein